LRVLLVMDIIEIVRLLNSRDIFKVNKFIDIAIIESFSQVKTTSFEDPKKYFAYLLKVSTDPLGIFLMFLYFDSFPPTHNQPLSIVIPLFPAICVLLTKFFFFSETKSLFKIPFIAAAFSSFFYDMILFAFIWFFLTSSTVSLLTIFIGLVSVAVALRPYLIELI